ncbi:SDR family NAD(P)-dependent oxidoreductase [Serratia rubidaea]|uniref:SDR family oxidoreductase n=1 Tax=Serratia rubidaea TaxID=61652 RepID=UPI00234A9894|nr:SDR family NAD(P)-dependent oxidoreductase [Serratia rubidaea]MDC6120838.1 SDR family NAD(P)-dependent oxidoreductase [Serratia rubidaea]
MGDKKLVLITAGSRGIGAVIVKELVQQGYRVVFTYRENREAAESLAKSLNIKDDVCWCYPCDAGNLNEVKKLCEVLLTQHGVPYGIINNAGKIKDTLHFDMKIDDWLDVINTNLNSIVYLNHYLLNAMMLNKDGCIININSIAGLRGNVGQTNYSASKSAQYGLTKSLAREVGNFNIRVNCIAPGPVATDMISSVPKKTMDQLIKLTPLRKMGEPEDIAMMVTFLLGAGGRHITGQTLVVDGGLSI